jgi:hypothetical protein
VVVEVVLSRRITDILSSVEDVPTRCISDILGFIRIPGTARVRRTLVTVDDMPT